MTAIDPDIIKKIEENLEKKLTKKFEEKISKSIESIQIKILKENFLTRDEFLEAMQKIDDRFNAVQKQMDDRFNAMQKQMDDRFNAMQKQMDKRFEHVYRRFEQMDLGYGYIVEGFGYSLIKKEFELRGLELRPKFRHHFTDSEYIVFPDTTDVEIDIFQCNPNIIGEATLKLTDIEKLRTFIRKIQFIEKMYKEEFKRFFICFHVEDSIKDSVNFLLNKYNIELIIPEQVD
ncbi:MAG: hypothetical protein ACP6IY_12590 [Promethearchaeia archaeon]